MSSDWI